jgi:hypothetical protein
MNCGCIKRLEGEIAQAPFVKAKAGENITVTCAATGFQMTDDMDLKLVINIPFRIRGTGKGFTSEKGKEMPVVASYCPFCGKPANGSPSNDTSALGDTGGAK